jgi:hypothetical protein
VEHQPQVPLRKHPGLAATERQHPQLAGSRPESDKQALVQDQNSPFFTTPRFDGHPSVLVRASRISELTLQELTEIVHDA